MISRSALDELISELASRGFTVIGPTVRDRAILYEEISSTADLPEGLTDEQEGGTYRLARAGRRRALRLQRRARTPGRAISSRPTLTLWGPAADGRRDQLQGGGAGERPALRLHRRALLRPGRDRASRTRSSSATRYTDPDYEARRARRLHRRGQLLEGRQHLLLRLDGHRAASARAGTTWPSPSCSTRAGTASWSRSGSERGRRGARRDRRRARPTEDDEAAAAAVSEECASQMGRELDTDGIKELLYRNMEHPRWDEVSERCLTCGNCTLVCPTCFCHTRRGRDRPRRRGGRAGAPMGLLLHARPLLHPRRQRAQLARASRYRQWMTHKLATWIDQFGTSGCVGCGRCITWCPVAIDITEEAAAIRATDLGPDPARAGGSVQTIEQLLAEAPAFNGMSAGAPGADRRLRRRTRSSRTAST